MASNVIDHELAEAILRKREVMQTTNTNGWRYIRQMAEHVVKDLERRAIDEEDDVKGNALRREAKAARKFLNEFLTSIEKTCSFDDTGDNWAEVAME